jgi:cell pole-organizing protein PopZ
MAEKNTRSILESIKNKIGKIDKKDGQLPDDVASQFQYVATNHSEDNSNHEEVVENAQVNEDFSDNSQQESDQNSNDSGGDDLEDDSQESVEVQNPPIEFGKNDIEDYEDKIDFEAPKDAQNNAAQQGSENQFMQDSSSVNEDLQLPDLEVDDLVENLPEVEDDLSLDVAQNNLPEEDLEDELEEGESEEDLEEEELEDDLEVEENLEDELDLDLEEKHDNLEDNSAKDENIYDAELEKLERELEEQEKKSNKNIVESKNNLDLEEPAKEKDIEDELEEELMNFNAPSQDFSKDFASETKNNDGLDFLNNSNQTSSNLIKEETLAKTKDSLNKLIYAKEMTNQINNFSNDIELQKIAIEILEPKLEAWLNDNLPSLVEEIVRQEIAKITNK